MQDSEMNAYYSQWWENPRDIRNLVFQSLNNLVRSRIPPARPGASALDIGSGRGMVVSFLLEKGYQVTALDINEDFVGDLRRRFPAVRVIHADVCDLDLEEHFDVVTMIEVTQNLEHSALKKVLERLSGSTTRLLINISNQHSLHGLWTELRRFRAPFVVPYIPAQLDAYLAEAGFGIVYSRGVGLVTPISLLSNFRLGLIPVWLARVVNRLDPYASRLCHLYYVEALGGRVDGMSLEPGSAQRFYEEACA